jgi:hypothetical protein
MPTSAIRKAVLDVSSGLLKFFRGVHEAGAPGLDLTFVREVMRCRPKWDGWYTRLIGRSGSQRTEEDVKRI